MSEQSMMHFYLNWAKERIDEMDATLASLEGKASQMQADLKAKANQLRADLQKRRDEFQAIVKKQGEAGEAAWAHTKIQLESDWNNFEAAVKTYIETVGKQVGQQQATFRDVAAAQVKAWRAAADQLHGAAAKVAASRRADIDAAIKQMNTEASEAEARLQKLKQAGSKSWAALGAGLANRARLLTAQIKWLGTFLSARLREVVRPQPVLVEVRSSAEAVTPMDVVVSRELKSLQEELSASSENAWHHV